MDRSKSNADVVRRTSLNWENGEPSPTWLRTYQREDEEEAMKKATRVSLEEESRSSDFSSDETSDLLQPTPGFNGSSKSLQVRGTSSTPVEVIEILDSTKKEKHEPKKRTGTASPPTSSSDENDNYKDNWHSTIASDKTMNNFLSSIFEMPDQRRERDENGESTYYDTYEGADGRRPMTGALNMQDNTIINVADPTNNKDVVNLQKLNSELSSKVDTSTFTTELGKKADSSDLNDYFNKRNDNTIDGTISFNGHLPNRDRQIVNLEFLGLKEQALQFGIGGFSLKLFRLEKSSTGKCENLDIVTDGQWQLQLPNLISDEGSSELNSKS
ncbi:hypothetical protein AWC38_SpisGene3736 [Stylophora pistillata]|uniref:Uncharacterized protein n=1 Tax=Stylophora pistillata TaxID=50429 RepID=A0A2B4SQS0_STYPI|nr:hypothetical protein AWC38_SpisGene3736 [Stylophora pistillata]